MTFNTSIDWLRKDAPKSENLSIIRNSSTSLSVRAGNGSALSARNAGFITLPSKTVSGALNVYRITADQTVTQSDLGTGNLFGLTTAVAHATDLPFYVYAVVNDAENDIAFMLSRYPNTRVSPVSAKISQAGSSAATTQGSFFSMKAITATDYDENPCVCIGSLRVQKDASNNWTFTAFDFGDGIGQFQLGRKFIFAVSQYGAASGKYFRDNGGTAPRFISNSTGYFVDQFNFLRVSTVFTNCDIAGLGTVRCQLAVPYDIDGAPIGAGTFFTSAGNYFPSTAVLDNLGPANAINLIGANNVSNLILDNASVTVFSTYFVSHSIDANIVFT